MNSAGKRIDVDTVRGIERVVGGDPVSEEAVLRFIAARYGARSLLFLPANVAAEICRRPKDFLKAAREHGQPELEL